MIAASMISESEGSVAARAQVLYQAQRSKMHAQIDRLFAGLLVFEWIAAIAIALVFSPRAWSGSTSSIHPHVWAAIFFGGALCALPATLVWCRFEGNQQGSRLNRHVIAIAQMLTSSLLIQITGGRIETHFHVFGSLAFLAFYRDWEVLLTASAVTGADHLVRGLFWPYTIFGRTWASPWRTAEHVAWVAFDDIFLIWSCLRSNAEMLMISHREARNAHLLHQAQHDALTGLPNRLLFTSSMEEGLARADATKTKLALLCIDLDRFKQINDTLGHHVGDKVLQEVSRLFSAQLGESGTLVRLGGDEFAVILNDVHEIGEAALVAGKLVCCLNDFIAACGHNLQVGASIGISLYPDGADNAVDLQKNADIAMYRVKSAGRNGFECFSNDMAVPTLARMDMEQQLRLAITRDEFRVLYQPKVTMEGTLVGFETLVRWLHPELGMISPMKFFPLAKETGLIKPIGEFMMREGCRQALLWQNRFGKNLSVSVNVSAIQFGDPAFPDTVARIVAEESLPPCLLQLEISEMGHTRDLQSLVTRLARMQALGVVVADGQGFFYEQPLTAEEAELYILESEALAMRTDPITTEAYAEHYAPSVC